MKKVILYFVGFIFICFIVPAVCTIPFQTQNSSLITEENISKVESEISEEVVTNIDKAEPHNYGEYATIKLMHVENAEIEGESGGGVVKVVVNGKKVVTSITISPNAVDPDDMEMLEDLIIAALNSAYDEADELYNEKMGKFGNAGGMF